MFKTEFNRSAEGTEIEMGAGHVDGGEGKERRGEGKERRWEERGGGRRGESVCGCCQGHLFPKLSLRAVR